MAGEWRESTWGEEISLEYGKALRGYDGLSGQFRVFGSNGPIGWTSQPLAPGPGVILGRKGAYRGVQYSREPFFVIDTAYYVVPKTGLDMRWLYYAIKHHKLGEIDDGSPIPSTTRSAVYVRDLDVPPLSQQRAIAHILGTLDDKIELNRRMNETLEAMARALFKSWFVDFLPVRAKQRARTQTGDLVRAKAEGRLPAAPGAAQAGDTGLPKDIADLFPDSFQDSELGEIPNGWKTGCFGDVAEQLRDQEYPLASPEVLFSHFSIPSFDDAQWAKIEPGESIKSQKSRVPPGVVLLSKLNPEIERVWLVDVEPTARAISSTEFLVLRPRPPYERSYVYCLARSPFFRQQIETLVTGTSNSHQRAQADSILSLTVILPPKPIAVAFDKAASPLLCRTLACRRESRALAALRDKLLPKLISGEMRV